MTKKFKYSALEGLISLALIMMLSGCKKNSEDPAVIPTFTVVSSVVNLQAGGEGLQFYAKCTNTNVKMEHITITNPSAVTVVRDYNSISYVKNEIFPMQETDAAYVKKTGTWKFDLVGSRISDGVTFAVDTTLVVSK
jgi:hypothetical protein